MIKSFDDSSKRIALLSSNLYQEYNYENSMIKESQKKFLFFAPKKSSIIILFRESVDLNEIEKIKQDILVSAFKYSSLIVITKTPIDKRIERNRKIKTLVLSTVDEKLSWPKIEKKEKVIHERLSFLLNCEIEDPNAWEKEMSHFIDVVSTVMEVEL